jgi:Dimerisation domain
MRAIRPHRFYPSTALNIMSHIQRSLINFEIRRSLRRPHIERRSFRRVSSQWDPREYRRLHRYSRLVGDWEVDFWVARNPAGPCRTQADIKGVEENSDQTRQALLYQVGVTAGRILIYSCVDCRSLRENFKEAIVAPGSDTSTAAVQLLQMMTGYWVSQGVDVTAKLGIADHLATGPVHYEDLARKTNTHALSLYRILRALASIGVFAEISGPVAFAVITIASWALRPPERRLAAPPPSPVH